MLLDWTLAVAPLLLIVLLMVRFRWGIAKAGPAGWLAAVVIATWRFGAGADVLAVAHVRALFRALDVLLIVWTAFLLYRVADEAGAIRTLGTALPHLTADRGMQALLIGWTFASFLQGVGGFGVPVAVTAPLLVGLGFSPLTAVLAPSVGHAWSVTFGSLASSFQALVTTTGLDGQVLAPPSAILLGLAGFGCGFMVVHISDGWRGVRRLALPVLVLATVMGGIQYALASHGLWNIAGFGGGMVGLAAALLLSRQYRGSQTPSVKNPDGRLILRALVPYIALIVFTLLIQFAAPLRDLLGRVVLQVPTPATQTWRGFLAPADPGTRIVLLRHAGAILCYASLAAYWINRRAGAYAPGAARRIVAGTIQGMASATLGILAMVSLSVVMAQSGMTDVLARGLAQAAGGLLPLVTPWIGALGAFISGSNTNSNFLFGILQLRTAELLGLSAPRILAGQTAGAAIGSMVAPTKVVVGVSSAGEGVEEGTVIRKLLVYTGLLLAGLSLALWCWLKIQVG
jgi:lactate permease